MTRMYFIRHGQSRGNLDGRFYGCFDGPLTDLGREQARRAADYLAHVRLDAAYASDLSRAYETGVIAAAPHGLTVTPDKGLREIFAGEWENQPFDELGTRFPEDWKVWREDLWRSRPTGGESVAELAARVRTEVWQIASRHDGQNVLIATHATPLRALVCEWQKLPDEAISQIGWVKNASVSVVDYDTASHTITVKKLAEAGFLNGMETSLPTNV